MKIKIKYIGTQPEIVKVIKGERKMKIEVGKTYVIKERGSRHIQPYVVKVFKIGFFKVFCKWTVYNWKDDYSYEDCGWKSKRRFICEEKKWFGGEE